MLGRRFIRSSFGAFLKHKHASSVGVRNPQYMRGNVSLYLIGRTVGESHQHLSPNGFAYQRLVAPISGLRFPMRRIAKGTADTRAALD